METEIEKRRDGTGQRHTASRDHVATERREKSVARPLPSRQAPESDPRAERAVTEAMQQINAVYEMIETRP
jgi:hypothetical protein